MYSFPENLFTEVRIEKSEYVNYYTANGEVEAGLKAVDEAQREYVEFLEGIAIEQITK